MGIRDAAALAEVILTAQKDQQDLGDQSVLQKYDRWRRPENLVILAFTDILDRFFSYQFLPLIFLRRLGLFALRRIPPIKSFALRLMTGLLGRSARLT
jgi:2-octaprenyl-6-methoxyphenol hydroxylase